MESQRWLAAVIAAYDERLRLACRRLGLVEHLQPLAGIDRDIERVRVEGLLAGGRADPALLIITARQRDPGQITTARHGRRVEL